MINESCFVVSTSRANNIVCNRHEEVHRKNVQRDHCLDISSVFHVQWSKRTRKKVYNLMKGLD